MLYVYKHIMLYIYNQIMPYIYKPTLLIQWGYCVFRVPASIQGRAPCPAPPHSPATRVRYLFRLHSNPEAPVFHITI